MSVEIAQRNGALVLAGGAAQKLAATVAGARGDVPEPRPLEAVDGPAYVVERGGLPQ
ncbi:MAG: hypothetical protein HOV80_34385, partial [Polyangiaceae bacterium]|nr:hypothetical protein [Polyangiaceae bacterium]